MSETPAIQPKRLVRSNDRWLGGVCAGLARYFGIDANLVRLIVVIGTILGFGSLIIAYIVAWILMPQEH
ncbi:MAG TPA: PspC domain-containing protein [Nocardioidaceae bacterium]|nr:PspC domain-containing protein [Nocardioidaceae bacterium]